jgi:glycosyltransferase involved in cell wall biosynthesis
MNIANPSSGGAGLPRVSVITTTLNAVESLPWTIASLRAQTACDFEWIVVDAGSSDGTLAFLEAARDVVSVLISRPGIGIAAAWNAAVPWALGDWLLFLGAGDELAAPAVLQRMAPHLDAAQHGHTMVYGRIALIEQGTRQVIELRGAPWEGFAGRWVLFRPLLPVHPEVFHHRSLFDQGQRFDEGLRYASDTEFLLRQASRQGFLFVPETITRMEFGGVTGQLQNLRAISVETRAIARRFGLQAPLAHRVLQHAKLWLADALSRCLPSPALRRVEHRFRRLRRFGFFSA